MKTVAETEHLLIVNKGLKPGRKTFEYLVLIRRSKAMIGSVSWYAPWRQFCFFPQPGTVWNKGCLSDVRDFLTQAARERAATVRKGGTP